MTQFLQMGVSANTIDFSDLEFKYEGIEQILRNVSFLYTVLYLQRLRFNWTNTIIIFWLFKALLKSRSAWSVEPVEITRVWTFIVIFCQAFIVSVCSSCLFLLVFTSLVLALVWFRFRWRGQLGCCRILKKQTNILPSTLKRNHWTNGH